MDGGGWGYLWCQDEVEGVEVGDRCGIRSFRRLLNHDPVNMSISRLRTDLRAGIEICRTVDEEGLLEGTCK